MAMMEAQCQNRKIEPRGVKVRYPKAGRPYDGWQVEDDITDWEC